MFVTVNMLFFWRFDAEKLVVFSRTLLTYIIYITYITYIISLQKRRHCPRSFSFLIVLFNCVCHDWSSNPVCRRLTTLIKSLPSQKKQEKYCQISVLERISIISRWVGNKNHSCETHAYISAYILWEHWNQDTKQKQFPALSRYFLKKKELKH